MSDLALYYLTMMKEVDKIVKEEVVTYQKLVPFRKQQQLTSNLKNYCDMVRSANRYRKLEKNNPSYTKHRLESEYFELLQSTRLRKKLQASDESDLQNYVNHLKYKLSQALVENDTKKRFKFHDYINAGCNLCKVDNEFIMSQIVQLKSDAQQIIFDIPTM